MDEKRIEVDLSQDTIDALLKKGLIKISDNGMYWALCSVFFKPSINFEEAEKVPENRTNARKRRLWVTEWIKEWRDLFPGKLNTNTGLSYRGDRSECIKKMDKFVAENPTITKEDIIRVTRISISEARTQRRLEFMPAAHYFIEKKGHGSRLGQALENLENTYDSGTENRTVI